MPYVLSLNQCGAGSTRERRGENPIGGAASQLTKVSNEARISYAKVILLQRTIGPQTQNWQGNIIGKGDELASLCGQRGE